MLLDVLVFDLGKSSRLEQHTVLNTDHPDVVQSGTERQRLNVPPRGVSLILTIMQPVSQNGSGVLMPIG